MQTIHSNISAAEVIESIEEVSVKILDIYMIRNKQMRGFTGLVKLTLLGNLTMNTWLENDKT